MMNNQNSIIKAGMIILTIISVGIKGHAQVLTTIKNSFQQYQDQVFEEKLYVHTDRSFYLTGEILWFKIYNVDAASSIPVNISKVAYVDLLDGDNHAVLQAKILLSNAKGNGSFYIPLTLKNGNYRLRAYTNWMKNFSPEFYFEKIISIVNPLNEPVAAIKQKINAIQLHFFPESGNLITGVNSAVGFKAVDNEGRGITVTGIIRNQHNDTVIRFRSLKFGIGSFLFTPVANDTYTVVAHTDDSRPLVSELPAVMNSGYSIHLSQDTAHFQVKISAQGPSARQPVYLIGYCGHQIFMARSINPGADSSIMVNKAVTGKGINHFVLFNGDGHPLCERLCFNRPGNLLKITATASTAYKTRNQVTIKVHTAGPSAKSLTANMSIAVYHLDSLNRTDDGGITSSIWLSSELRGNVESPGYYFGEVNAETDRAIDNLMITQGWSRFTWPNTPDTVRLPPVKYLPEYNGHIISAHLTTATGVSYLKNIYFLGVMGKRAQLYGSAPDSAGQLLFNTKDMYGPGEIVVQTNSKTDSTSVITVQSPFSEQYSAKPLPSLKLLNQFQRQLQVNSINMQTQNIYSPAMLKQYFKPLTDTAGFYGSTAKSYLLDDFTRFSTIEEVLREYVTDVNVGKRGDIFNIKVSGSNGFLNQGDDPLVLLDGIPVLDINRVFTIDPLKVKRLDVVNQVYYLGPILANGILSFSTSKGDMAGLELNPHAVVLDYEGLQLEREFYSPDYQTDIQKKSRTPDFRNLLFWSHDVNTASDGNTTLSFYTSDKTGKYIGVIQGLTTGGEAGSGYFYFEVDK